MRRKIGRRPGKAGKRRTLRVAVPRVGDLVAVRWIDSGSFVLRSFQSHKDVGLDMIVTYGVVVDRDEHRTVLASEHGDDMDDGEVQMRNVIWNESITGCVVLRKGGK